MNILDTILKFNLEIDASKEIIEHENLHEDELNDVKRDIEFTTYEKVKYIKSFLNEVDTNNLCENDKKLIQDIFDFKQALPEDMHKCIGCPCLENDYPNCHSCIFQISCLMGCYPYPNSCDESDCFKTFEYMSNNPLKRGPV